MPGCFLFCRAVRGQVCLDERINRLEERTDRELTALRGEIGGLHQELRGTRHSSGVRQLTTVLGLLAVLGNTISPAAPTVPSALARVGLGSLLGAIGGTIGVNLSYRG